MMSIKNRIKKLENVSNPNHSRLHIIIVYQDETNEEAKERYLKENPDVKGLEGQNIVYINKLTVTKPKNEVKNT